LRIDWVESRVEELERSLAELQKKYDSLCLMIKQQAVKKVETDRKGSLH
jgi:hypothetical protein